MYYTGTILKVKGKRAVIITDEADFIEIKARPGMISGKQIIFDGRDIIHGKKTVVCFSLAAAVILSLIILMRIV